MKNFIERYNISDWLFIVPFYIYIIIEFLQYTTTSASAWLFCVLATIHPYLLCALILLFRFIIFQHHDFKRSICVLFAGLILGYTGLIQNNLGFLWIFLFMIASEKISLDYIVKTYLRIISCLLIINYVFAIIEGNAFAGFIYRGIFWRLYLGTVNPNVVGMLIFSLICCWLYLRRNDSSFSKRELLILVVTVAFEFLVINSLTATIMTVFIVFVFILYGKFKLCNTETNVNNKLRLPLHYFRRFPVREVITLAVVSQFAILFFNIIDLSKIAWLNWFEKLLSNRVTAVHGVLQIYSPKLFGQIVDLQLVAERLGGHYGFLDPLVFQLVLRWGIIFALLFFIRFTYIIIDYYRSANYDALIFVLCVMLIYSCAEGTVFSLFFSPFVLCLGFCKVDDNRL